MDDETRQHIKSLHESVNLLSENLDFLIKMDRRTLLILIQIAYVLERVSNKTFDLEESPDEPSPERIEAAFREIRKRFDEQQEIMKGENLGDD